MKKALVTLAALMTAFFMISCQNETTSGNTSGNTSENIEDTKDTTAEKVALYNKLVGTSWKGLLKDVKNEYSDTYFLNLDTVSFTENTVTIDSQTYDIDVPEDLYFHDELELIDENEDLWARGWKCVIYIHIYDMYYGFNGWINNSGDHLTIVAVTGEDDEIHGKHDELKLVSSSDSSSSDSSSTETVTLSGNYTISQADGSSISFTDGNWSYTYNSSSKSGTYSQSGSELTMNFTMGSNSVSGVFTVSKDGDNIKLTGKSGDCTTIVSSAFMVKDSDAITNGNVTLTAK